MTGLNEATINFLMYLWGIVVVPYTAYLLYMSWQSTSELVQGWLQRRRR